MTLLDAIHILDTVIPDHMIEKELRTLLLHESREDGCAYIEFSAVEGGSIPVPIDINIEIITKAFFKEYITTIFGDFRVQVALGGSRINEYGVLIPTCCFATLWFNADGQRFAIDFHLEAR